MLKETSVKTGSIEGKRSTNNWYSRLKQYFPEREMKSKIHFETLFQEKQESYQILEGEDFIVVYFEQCDYIFIDYILVSGSSRGKGVGSFVLNEFKKRGKAIILEVEPISLIDPDSEKRIRFYARHDFEKMDEISYERNHMVTKELNKMDIYCWSQTPKTQQWVLACMQEIYVEVHAYKVKEIYGEPPQQASDVLWLRNELEKTVPPIAVVNI